MLPHPPETGCVERTLKMLKMYVFEPFGKKGFFFVLIKMWLYQSTMGNMVSDSHLSIQDENSYPESPLAKVMTSSVPSQLENS